MRPAAEIQIAQVTRHGTRWSTDGPCLAAAEIDVNWRGEGGGWLYILLEPTRQSELFGAIARDLVDLIQQSYLSSSLPTTMAMRAALDTAKPGANIGAGFSQRRHRQQHVYRGSHPQDAARDLPRDEMRRVVRRGNCPCRHQIWRGLGSVGAGGQPECESLGRERRGGIRGVARHDLA